MNGQMLYFSYDGNGDIISATYLNENYYYIRNPQGDVIAIVNESGEIEEEYTYDAWGKATSTPTSTIGILNPFRYRGYIYDSDIGLEVTKDVLPQKQSEPAFVSYSSISTKSEEKLTTKDRVVNTVIGASLGAAAAGGIIAIGGVALSLGAGATTVIAGVGMTGAQISAIGALVYNGFAMVVAPFLGVEVEPLEYAP